MIYLVLLLPGKRGIEAMTLTSFKTPNKTQKFGCVLVAKMPEKQSNKQQERRKLFL